MEQTSTLFTHWDKYMTIAGSASILIGILIFLYHEFKVLQVKDYKLKYDYVNLHEIRYFWYTVMAFIVAAFFFANTMLTEKVLNAMLWFYVRIFITVSF